LVDSGITGMATILPGLRRVVRLLLPDCPDMIGDRHEGHRSEASLCPSAAHARSR
jgi:hypothetical protein